jgi:hypothetical protein
VVEFDADVDRPNMGAGFSACADIFVDASSLGAEPLCHWRNSRTLIARFGQAASLAIGDQLSLKPNLILAAGSSKPQNEPDLLELVVVGPDSPAAPVAVIEGTSAVGWCDVLTLDASASYGSGGRDFVGGYVWALVPPEDNSTDIVEGVESYLAEQRDVVVSLDGPSLNLNTSRTYIFSLTLTNWLGLSSTAYFPVEIIATDQVIVRIAGGNVRPPLRFCCCCSSHHF